MEEEINTKIRQNKEGTPQELSIKALQLQSKYILYPLKGQVVTLN